MYKALKLVVAGLNSFTKEGLNDNIISDGTLKKSINQTMNEIRTVLCYFNVSIDYRNVYKHLTMTTIVTL